MKIILLLSVNGCKFARFNLGGCYQLGNDVREDIRKAFELNRKSASNPSETETYKIKKK